MLYQHMRPRPSGRVTTKCKTAYNRQLYKENNFMKFKRRGQGIVGYMAYLINKRHSFKLPRGKASLKKSQFTWLGKFDVMRLRFKPKHCMSFRVRQQQDTAHK